MRRCGARPPHRERAAAGLPRNDRVAPVRDGRATAGRASRTGRDGWPRARSGCLTRQDPRRIVRYISYLCAIQRYGRVPNHVPEAGLVVRRQGLRDVVVAGIYQTKQARQLPGETSDSLTVEAVHGALADAGLRLSDVDGFNIQIGSPSVGNDFAYKVGAPYFWLGRTHVSPDAVVEAALAISAGHCEVALLSSAQAGLYTDRKSTAPWTRPPNEFIETWGLHTPAEWALPARRYMHLYGGTPDQSTYVAAVIRNNGH